MYRLIPRIHSVFDTVKQDADGRDKPGHDIEKILDPIFAAALATLIDIEEQVLQLCPLPAQTLLA